MATDIACNPAKPSPPAPGPGTRTANCSDRVKIYEYLPDNYESLIDPTADFERYGTIMPHNGTQERNFVKSVFCQSGYYEIMEVKYIDSILVQMFYKYIPIAPKRTIPD